MFILSDLSPPAKFLSESFRENFSEIYRVTTVEQVCIYFS